MIPKMKAWDKRGKKMYSVACIDLKGGDLVKGYPGITIQEDGSFFELKHIELLLISNCTDIDEKEIVEGDIVYRYETQNKYVVSFDGSEFRASLLVHDFETSLSCIWPFKLLGNRFENPELLEEK